MKVFKILPVFAISAILVVPSFALPASSIFPGNLNQVQSAWKAEKSMEHEKDPIARLKEKRTKIQELLLQGKISKEEAEARLLLIDVKIRKIEEFNKLPLNDKKERLISNFKAFMSDRVKEGKITQEKANQIILEYTKRVNAWDGSGNPPRMGKCSSHRKDHGARMKE